VKYFLFVRILYEVKVRRDFARVGPEALAVSPVYKKS
jgi:hypothetical protein